MKTESSFCIKCIGVIALVLASNIARADGWLFLQNSTDTLVLERDPITSLTSPVLVGAGKVEMLYAPFGTTDLNLFHPIVGVAPLSRLLKSG